MQKVQKPARYSGGEYGQTIKNKSQVNTRIALCFPDTYEIGMSNLGFRILYGLANKMDGVSCERVFAPWGDMHEEMSKARLGLYGLESGDAIKDFDIVAFSLGYEMAYTTALSMLELAGIPKRAKDRTSLSPLVIAAGHARITLNRWRTLSICLSSARRGSQRRGDRRIPQSERLRCEQIGFFEGSGTDQGRLCPDLYDIDYKTDGTIAAITPLDGAELPVVKRIVENFDEAYYPAETIIRRLKLSMTGYF